jgi:hypothetical protein
MKPYNYNHMIERKKPVRHEDQFQIAVVDFIRSRYPGTLFTIAPNGIKLSKRIAVRLKALGYSAGTPDIMIFEPRGDYHGLFIEIKTPNLPGMTKGRASDAQLNWMSELNARGYMGLLCFGSSDAIDQINNYLKGGTNAGN